MDAQDLFIKFTINYFSGFITLIWGIIRLYRLNQKKIEITNKVIQPDLDALFLSIMMVVFGILVLIGKITGKI